MPVLPQKDIKIYILPIILFPILFLLCMVKMIDSDVWFHMKAGQVIIESGSFLYHDIFSVPAIGNEWLYHEWLFGVIAFKTFDFFGINGLIIGKTAYGR